MRAVLEPGGLDVSSVNADEECRWVCIPRSRNVANGAKRGDSKESREKEMQGLCKKNRDILRKRECDSLTGYTTPVNNEIPRVAEY